MTGGTLSLTNDMVDGNTAAKSGGGFYSQTASPLTINGSTFNNNRSDKSGGGICIFYGTGSPNLANDTVDGNTALGSGGGLFANGTGTLHISGSTFSANTTATSGGGITYSSLNGGTFQLTNDTIYGNKAAALGGGLHAFSGNVNLQSDTISANNANFGGGVYNSGAAISVDSTIIAANTAPALSSGPDALGNFMELNAFGYNLIGLGGVLNGNSGFTGSKDLVGTSSALNPKLGPLQNNGGPTFTANLLPGSPAIGVGDPGGPATDQRGFPRPPTNPAIGAYQPQPLPVVPTNLVATAGNAQVALTWTTSMGAFTYNVYRGTSSGGEGATPIATGITTTSFTNTGLTVGTTYFYKVTAVTPDGQSGFSQEVSASPFFSDNFNRPNSTNLGSNWTTFIGQMGIAADQAAGQSGLVDLAQVNSVSLTNVAVSALPNVGLTGQRYAGVFARRDASGNMYVGMLGVNSAANPAGSPTAALLFRFTPGLAGTVSGGWSFLTFKLLPTPPNTGSANLGLDVTGTGLATTLHLYLNGTLTLTFVESQTAAIGVSQHPLNNPGGVGLLSVDAGTTYGNFIAGLPGSVPQAQELAGSPASGLSVNSLTAAELAPIVTAAEARWEAAGLSAAEESQLQGLQFVVTSLAPGTLGDYVPGTIYLDATADGWGWFVDPTPGQNEEYSSAGNQLQALPGSGAAGHVDLLTVVMHEMGHALGLPDITVPDSTDLMAEALATGLRRLPSLADIDAVFASQV